MTETAETEPRQIEKAPDAAPSAGMTAEAIATRRATLQQTIDQERAKRAAATLDGGTFDPAALRAAEDELDGLTDAEGEAARRDRAKAAEAAEKQRQALRRRVPKQVKQLRVAVEDAEAAARALVEAYGRAEAARAGLHTTVSLLNGSSPTALMPGELETRCGRALAAVIHGQVRKSHFGPLALKFGAADPAASWTAELGPILHQIEQEAGK